MWEGELAGDDVDADVVLECFCADWPIAPASSVKASCVDFGGDFDRAEAGDAITRVRNEEADEAAGVIVAPSQACYSGLSVSRQAGNREMDFEHSKAQIGRAELRQASYALTGWRSSRKHRVRNVQRLKHTSAQWTD